MSALNYIHKTWASLFGNYCSPPRTNFNFSEPVCSELSFEKAQVTQSGYVSGNKVFTVACLKPKHYVLLGDKEVTCQSAGWITATGAMPECRRCGESKFETVFELTS